MIVTEQVERSVEHQDFDFRFDGVAEFGGLGLGAGGGYGKVA